MITDLTLKDIETVNELKGAFKFRTFENNHKKERHPVTRNND